MNSNERELESNYSEADDESGSHMRISAESWFGVADLGAKFVKEPSSTLPDVILHCGPQEGIHAAVPEIPEQTRTLISNEAGKICDESEKTKLEQRQKDINDAYSFLVKCGKDWDKAITAATGSNDKMQMKFNDADKHLLDGVPEAEKGVVLNFVKRFVANEKMSDAEIAKFKECYPQVAGKLNDYKESLDDANNSARLLSTLQMLDPRPTTRPPKPESLEGLRDSDQNSRPEAQQADSEVERLSRPEGQQADSEVERLSRPEGQ